MNPIRVLLVDDHPIVRAGIRNLLEQAPPIEIVGEAADGADGVALALQLNPDVILLDLEMPGMKGNEVARELKSKGCTSQILILSAHDDPGYVQEVFGIGVAGFLLKEEAPNLIIDAICGAARGESGWVSRAIASQFGSWLKEDKSATHGLSEREWQVLKAVVAGKTNQEIGFSLSVSEKTVEKHIFSILNKLGVASRVEAAVMAVREGWI